MLSQLFIDAGWHTVPMKGELRRLENGKKTLPDMEYDWRRKYTLEKNTRATELAGAITGACSGIIAIDCDNQATVDLFKGLEPNANFYFKSLGKPSGGCTFIFKFHERLADNFKLVTEDIALDFYSNSGFVYLPGEANFTKESWEGVTQLPELQELSPSTLIMLLAFKAKAEAPRISETRKVSVSNRLAPMLEVLVKSKKYDPVLFKILTPKSFRDIPAYVTKGHLHPNDVPQGRGSEYLSKVSAILGSDISVNVELYTNTMLFINSLWDKPMEKNALMSTIITPMVDERSSIDGTPIWQYDAHWDKMGFIATAINGDYVESFYDDVKGGYYLINYTFPYIKMFNDKRPILTTLKTLLGRNVTETVYDTSKQIVRTIVDPTNDFGHLEGCDTFNLFKQTPELSIINNPGSYASEYKRPSTIIKFFETLIPDDFARHYTLSFVRTKLTTFKYSPVILYFIGKPGSGKDTFVRLLGQILGKDYIAKPDTKVFLEQYNGWMLDKFIVQLDEYGNKLVRYSDKQEVLGKLKTYTGSEEMQVRAMRQDGFNYKHGITFIVTANSNPLPIEDEDRRVHYMETPNILANMDWVKHLGGVSKVQELFKAEMLDFAYYLATEVKNLPMDEYMIAPLTEAKDRLIFSGLSAADQIVYYLQNNKYDELANLGIDYGIRGFTDEWARNRLMDEKLAELYDTMTEGAGSHRKLIEKLRDFGLVRTHTTVKGDNIFYYQIPGLSNVRLTRNDEEVRMEFPDRSVKGLE